MNYNETILQLGNNLLNYFSEVFIHAETVSIYDDGKLKETFPAISKLDKWIHLAPTDQKETIYIRRNGNDEVLEELRLGSCGKAYRMRSQLRVVYFKDHAYNQEEIIFKLMQSVLVSGTKLKAIVRDKFRLLKDESSGAYNFGANTAYFAIDIYALWDLIPDNCENDFCSDLINPLKKELCLAAV